MAFFAPDLKSAKKHLRKMAKYDTFYIGRKVRLHNLKIKHILDWKLWEIY